ncbi:YARHG domain-containing protein [Prevotella sp. OH937_COT-195]|uniref:YARHG domain-containing protein n=1 Tax=Prevotella sp. OH937_COT-195 TaxID=2491051 RepID=UPI001F3ECADC|nr:YARHG domain-containing protein [Prevotella sp. OH937_COT-195]
MTLILLSALLTLTGINEAKAQVPSIPRKNRTTTQRSKRNYSNNIVWGTQYDWLSTRYVTYDDICEMDRGQVRVLKNSIYARHGRRFKDSELREYFNSQTWYNPWRNEVPAREFNKYENYNITFLHRYE